MTDAGWAEKKVDKHAKVNGALWVGPAVDLLKAEHARSVRIVKRRIAALKKLRDSPEEMHERGVDIAGERWRLQGLIDELDIILAALQRGRGGKG